MQWRIKTVWHFSKWNCCQCIIPKEEGKYAFSSLLVFSNAKKWNYVCWGTQRLLAIFSHMLLKKKTLQKEGILPLP